MANELYRQNVQNLSDVVAVRDVTIQVLLTGEQMKKLENASKLYSLQTNSPEVFSVEKLIQTSIEMGLTRHMDENIDYMDINSRATYARWVKEQEKTTESNAADEIQEKIMSKRRRR